MPIYPVVVNPLSFAISRCAERSYLGLTAFEGLTADFISTSIMAQHFGSLAL